MENLLLKECDISLTDSSFRVYAPNFEVAYALKKSFGQLAGWARNFGKCDTQVFYPGCRKPYQIPACLAVPSDPEQPEQPRLPMPTPQQQNLLGADYMRILEFLMQQRQEGNIVIITSNTTDICYHTNDMLTVGRAVWTPAQFTGYNYLKSWRATREEPKDSPQAINPQYDRLKSLLARDGYVPGYEYTLYRTDDALCSYSTTYFLCRDYCGDEVRIGVSRPKDWSLLELAPI